MTIEVHRKYIHEMVDKVRSERCLKQIYKIVHRAYLNDIAENGEAEHTTEGERLRVAIDLILDELNEVKLKEAHTFLHSYLELVGSNER